MSRIPHFTRIICFVSLVIILIAAGSISSHRNAVAGIDVTIPLKSALASVAASAGVATGDCDNDGDVDPDDWMCMHDCVSGPGVAYTGDCAEFDFDEDSDVDLFDEAVFQREYTGVPCPCDRDVNGDGMINGVDVGIVACPCCFMQPVENCNEPGADINCDGFVDQTDYDILTIFPSQCP